MRNIVAKTALAAGIVAASFSTAAVAQDLDGAVKARRGYYQVVRHNAGVLFGMAKGDIAYDAELATRAASSLQALAAVDGALLFPEGSDKDSLPGQTRALAVIWQDVEGITQKSIAFAGAVDSVAAAAGGGLDALQANVGQLGQSCKGCHDSYRSKDF